MELLEANIKHYRKQLGFTQQALADALETTKNTISNWENGVSTPGISVVIAMSKIFGVSLDELLIQDARHQPGRSLVSEPTPGYDRRNNLFVPIKAQASYASGWPDEHLTDDAQYIQVPGIEQDARTFEIEGHSMLPLIHPGDYVVSTRVERTDEISEGVIYLLVTRDQGILAKFIRLHADGLELISANFVEYRPFILPLADVREIWRARMKITPHFEAGQRGTTNPVMMRRIEKIETFLAELFPDFLEK